MLFKELHDKLYDYQRDGVSFLYGLYRDGHKGGVLADDMGLGKTIQIISFLSGMYNNKLIRHTLLVMPTSLITNWIKEFSNWTTGIRVKQFHGISKAERTRSLEKVQSRGGVIITTYTMLLNNCQQLASYRGKEFCWDYIILDEAHKIKNSSTKTAKSVYAISSKNRVLLTGTPVQNNLREMWTLFDFALQGSLLGTAKTFKTEYENPITRAREKDATPGEKALGSRMSENLMTLIKPYFLRRTKSEVQKKKTEGKEANSEPDGHLDPEDPPSSGAVMPKLTRKNDLIVWTYLSAVQAEIYRQFISCDHIKELLMTTRSPLAELNIIKKLCDHPRLLSANAIANFGLGENHEGENSQTAAHSIANVSDETLISESGKLVFLLALLEQLREEGHRTLIFSHYRLVLDILERILGNRGFKVLRLDGRITQIAEREKLISRFQSDKRYSVFLLTTQVGGMGITLTAASRVVIYDPSWNPATDAQAVDRVYRIGQKENVVIYRLITCGTVEEKIYRGQVFKDSLMKQNTGDTKNPFRYFSRQELKELFTLEDPRSSTTQLQLQALHSRHRRTDPALDEHIARLHAMHMFGISDHDLMFSLEIDHDEELENQEMHHYIQERVQKAQELMKEESELQIQLVLSTEPAWLRQTMDTDGRENLKKKNQKPLKSKPTLNPQPGKNFSNSTVGFEVEMDQSGSERNEPQQNMRVEVTDLSSDASPQKQSVDVRQLMEKSPGSDGSLQINSSDRSVGPNRTCPCEADLTHISPVPNRTASDASSIRAEMCRESNEASEGNFNPEPGDFVVEDAETEEEEQKLLSRLQMNGSFDVSRSLSESRHKEFSNSRGSAMDESVKDLSFTAKKQRATDISGRVEDDEEQQITSLQDNPFQMLRTSTPKSVASGSPAHHVRTTAEENAADISHHSPLQSTIKTANTLEIQEEESKHDEGSGISGKAVLLPYKEPQSEIFLETETPEEDDVAVGRFSLDSTYILEEDEEDSSDDAEMEKDVDELSDSLESNAKGKHEDVTDSSQQMADTSTEEEGEEEEEEVFGLDEEEGEEADEESEWETMEGFEQDESEMQTDKTREEAEEEMLEWENEETLEKEESDKEAVEEEIQDEKPGEEVQENDLQEEKTQEESEEKVMEGETKEWEPGEDFMSQEEESEKQETQGGELQMEELEETEGIIEEGVQENNSEEEEKTPEEEFNEQELMDKMSERDVTLMPIPAEENPGLSRTSDSKTEIDPISPQQSRRLPDLQELVFSFNTEQSRESNEFESVDGNFVLQLQDSYDVQEDEEDGEEEHDKVSEPQDRDVDVSKSLPESLQTIHSCLASASDKSSDEHLEMPHIKSPADDSVQVYEFSTPQSGSSGTSPHQLGNSVRGTNINAQDFKEEREDSKDDRGSYAPEKIFHLTGKEPQSEDTVNTGEEEDAAVDKSSLENTSTPEEQEDKEDNDEEVDTHGDEDEMSESNSKGRLGEDVIDLSTNQLQLDGREEEFKEDEMQHKDSEEEEGTEKSDEDVEGDSQEEETPEKVSEEEETQDETQERESEEEYKEEGSEKEENQEGRSEEAQEVLKEVLQEGNPEDDNSLKRMTQKEPAEDVDRSLEEAGPRQTSQRKTSQENQSVSLPEPEDELQTAPEEAAMGWSASGEEEQQQNLIDPDFNHSGASCQQDSADVGKPMDKSPGSESNLLQITADDDNDVFITTSQTEMMNIQDLRSPQSRRYPDIQSSESTFKAEPSSLSAELQPANKNLGLQQKDLYDHLEDAETEEESRVATNKVQNSVTDGSYGERQENQTLDPVNTSFQVREFSTPQSGSSGTSPHQLGNSVRGTNINAQDFKKEHEDSKDGHGSYAPEKIFPLTGKEPQSEDTVNTGEDKDAAVDKSSLENTSTPEEQEDKEDNDEEVDTHGDEDEMSESNSKGRLGEDVIDLSTNQLQLDGREEEFKEDEMQHKDSEEEEGTEKSDEEVIQEEEVVKGDSQEEETPEKVSEEEETQDETQEGKSKEEYKEEGSEKEENQEGSSEEAQEVLKEVLQEGNPEDDNSLKRMTQKEPAEDVDRSPEEADPKQTSQRKTSQENQSVSLPEPEDKLQTAPEEAAMGWSASGEEEQQQNLIDPDINHSGASCQQDSADVEKPIHKSPGSESNLLQITADDDNNVFITTSQTEMMNIKDLRSPQSRRVPDIQPSESTFKAEPSSLSAELQPANRNLSLQQKDLYNHLEDAETEDESRVATNKVQNSVTDGSYGERQENQTLGPVNTSFLVLGCSTPKPEPSGRSPPQLRKSAEGTMSGLSHHSLLQPFNTNIGAQDIHGLEVREDEDVLEKKVLPSTRKDFQSEELTQENIHAGVGKGDLQGYSHNMRFILEEDHDADEKKTEKDKDCEISEWSSEKKEGEDSTDTEIRLHESSGEEEFKEDEMQEEGLEKKEEERPEKRSEEDTQEAENQNEDYEQEEPQEVQAQESKSGDEEESEEEKIEMEGFENETENEMQEEEEDKLMQEGELNIEKDEMQEEESNEEEGSEEEEIQVKMRENDIWGTEAGESQVDVSEEPEEEVQEEDETQEAETEKDVPKERESLEVKSPDLETEEEKRQEAEEDTPVQEDESQEKESEEKKTKEEVSEEEQDHEIQEEESKKEESENEAKMEESKETQEDVTMDKVQDKKTNKEERAEEVEMEKLETEEPESEERPEDHEPENSWWQEVESDKKKMELEVGDIDHLQNSLQQCDLSFQAETSRVNSEFGPSSRNVLLQLEDITEDLQDTEEEEQKLLSGLQRNGRIDVNQSPSESLHRWTFNSKNVSNLDESINGFMKNKRAAGNYDEEEGDAELLLKSHPNKSLRVLGASTPKPRPSVSSPQITDKSSGENALVASSRSLLRPIVDDHDVEDIGSGVDGGGDVSGLDSETEEESVAFLTCNESRLQETPGKSLKAEDEEKRDAGYMSEETKLLTEKAEKQAGKKETETEDDGDLDTSEAKEEDDVICSSHDEVTNKEEEEDGSMVRNGNDSGPQTKMRDTLNFFLRTFNIRRT
ncbi:trichohyalin-like [Fundulus heteroclitus]|uniref:trichohyalin-like n=1 Tax=Fundulus heteroclitus TaxID=8078 RepID=UPI00165CC706|nr:trichohyalin-like [Fundulus heteroclitus]